MSFLPFRFKLTQIAVDTSAGPYKNYTVVLLGSDNGHVLKILASTEGANASFNTQLLEDIDVYNPNKSENTFFFFLIPCLFVFGLLLFLIIELFLRHLFPCFDSLYFLLSFSVLCFFLLYFSSSLFFLDLSFPLSLQSIVTLCIILYSCRRCFFYVVFCVQLEKWIYMKFDSHQTLDIMKTVSVMFC